MIVEIRTYQIKPGERDEFVRVMRTQSVPLLQKFGIAVLDCGPSLVDEDGAETVSTPDEQVTAEFAALGAHLHAHAGLWGEDGLRLAAIAARADAMYVAGDRTGSMVLVRALARRLFILSRSTPTPSQGGEDRPRPPGAAA